MSSSLATKALFGVLGAGVAGGTVVVSYTVFKKEKILKDQEEKSSPSKVETTKKSVAELLKQDGTKKLLVRAGKNGQDSEWKEVWKNYKDKNTSNTEDGSDPLKIPNWSTKRLEENAPDEFLNKCDEESKKEVSDTNDDAYIKINTWCTKDISTPKV